MADDGEKLGLATAIGIAGEMVKREGPLPKPAQLPLLALDVETGEAGEDEAEPETSRGPGRPPGARNKRTQEWVDYILARYPSPLVGLVEIYSRGLDDLKAELGCDRLEAFKVQMAAMNAALPFLHQKQPLAVTLDKTGVVHLTIEHGTVTPGDASGDDATVIGAVVLENENPTESNT